MSGGERDPSGPDAVRLGVGDGVAVVTLDDPGRRNALSPELTAGLVAAFEEIERRSDVGAVVVAATPPVFSAGGYLPGLVAEERPPLEETYAGFLAVARCERPTIAAVTGPAVGAGINVALACDVIVAGRGARFDARWLWIGIHPGGGHTWWLQRRVGRQGAVAMLLLGEVLSGEEAERSGLAWRCVDDDAVLEEAQRLASAATGLDADLTARTKATIDATGAMGDLDAAVERERREQERSMERPAFAERVRALRARLERGDARPERGDG